MVRSFFHNCSLNGRVAAVIEEKPLSQAELPVIERVKTAPPQEPTEGTKDQDQLQLPTPEPSPKKKNRKPLIFAVAGVAAIVAGNFGYHYWQHASTHEETDNATVTKHKHQDKNQKKDTKTKEEEKDNQNVKQGQLLVKLDPSDLQ